MKSKTRRCLVCRCVFFPDYRTRKQRVCSKKACQRQRKRREWRRWAARNKDQRKLKLRLWAVAYPHYWRRYRETHLEYRLRDSDRRLRAYRKAQSSAKQSLIRNLRAERLQSIRQLGLAEKSSAKQTLIAHQIKEVMAYLFWRDCSAKQTHIGRVGRLVA